jgi:hypothetical protein
MAYPNVTVGRNSVGIAAPRDSGPWTFTAYLEGMMDVIQNNGTGVTIQDELINNLRFADDIDLIEDSLEALTQQKRRHCYSRKI